MPAVESKMIELGTLAPEFTLPNTNSNYPGQSVSFSNFSESKGILIAFICNHCPYVVQLKSGFTEFARDYQKKGIAVVAISSNDVSTHPADAPENMTADALRYGYSFPYLYDESQAVARAYDARCTPDFYLFDAENKLVYRGQFDGSRPGNDVAVTGVDLRMAADALLTGQPVSQNQIASLGCSIKWKA